MIKLPFNKFGAIAIGLSIIAITYWTWHQRVFQRGYDKRVAEEIQAAIDAQPHIKLLEEDYDKNIQAIQLAPEGSCGVDPAITTILDRL